MDTSLLVSTRQWPDTLELCLQTVARQSLLPGEVIICEDGSGSETAALIEQMRRNFPIPIVHVWHADEGFRQGAIRNKGITKAEGRYLIQIDDNLLLHKHFVRDHVAIRRLGCFSAGSCMNISVDRSKLLLLGKISNPFLHFRNRDLLNALRWPWASRALANFFQNSEENKSRIIGGNMAFWKADLTWVNGYHESLHYKGNEDKELTGRLLKAGIQMRPVKFSALCYRLNIPPVTDTQSYNSSAFIQHTIESGIAGFEKRIGLW